MISHTEDEHDVAFPGDLVQLSVAIAFQDFRCHEHAVKMCENIRKRLGDTYRLTLSFWEFELFKFPTTRALAVNAALRADILIICASRFESVEPEFHHWLDDWSGTKNNNPAALVVLSPDSDPLALGKTSILIRLTEMTERLGLAYFSDFLTDVHLMAEPVQQGAN